MTVPSTFSQGSTEIWERLSQQDTQHVKELRCLNNPRLVPILRDELWRSFSWIVSTKIRPSILQETSFCRFITEEILLYFCSFGILKTQIKIFYIVPVSAQRCFPIIMDAMMSRRGAASSIFCPGFRSLFPNCARASKWNRVVVELFTKLIKQIFPQKPDSVHLSLHCSKLAYSSPPPKLICACTVKKPSQLLERRIIKEVGFLSEFLRVTIGNIITLDHLFVRSHVPTVRMALSKITFLDESVRRSI